MNINKKGCIVIALLLSVIIYCFGFSNVKKYEGLNILSELKIPLEINGWQGNDVEQEWNIEDEAYNFINQSFDRVYVNNDKNLFLLILDAVNFHHPKICSNYSGFEVKELNNPEFHVLNRTFRAQSLYAEKDDEGFLIIYWLCIDKNIVDWAGLKIKHLWFSLINKNRAGLMIRLAIPTQEDSIEDALRLAKEFIVDLGQAIPPDQAGYIFGNPKIVPGLSLN